MLLQKCVKHLFHYKNMCIICFFTKICETYVSLQKSMKHKFLYKKTPNSLYKDCEDCCGVRVSEGEALWIYIYIRTVAILMGKKAIIHIL